MNLSTENIETLKYVFINFPKESRALYTIINSHQMQYPSDHSLSYIDIVLKDILQSALSEGKLDLFSTYISFIVHIFLRK